jgi:hypothetical protein
VLERQVEHLLVVRHHELEEIHAHHPIIIAASNPAILKMLLHTLLPADR